jgi:demethylmenaquinone methyltransferase/2-methoxy-6-polyprenyl-1,4-benzoquinol methylase
MFDRIAERYDLLNRVISLGIDQSWRERTVRALDPRPGYHILDVATGTADLAILLARTESSSEIVGLDPSERMLEIGRRKVHDAALTERVRLVNGSAEALPFEDATFDGVTIAFGIRNVPDRVRGLTEMARVTRPGGHVAILELAEPRSGGWLAPLLRFHVHRVVPFLGGVLSGAPEYRYLQRSIQAFPPPEEFGRLMDAAGLDVVSVTPLTFGVAHLYLGRRRGPA